MSSNTSPSASQNVQYIDCFDNQKRKTSEKTMKDPILGPNLRAAFDQLANMLITSANAAQNQFKYSGQLNDLKEVIKFQSQAMECTPPDHPDRLGRLSSLSDSVEVSFTQFGQTDNLEQVIWYRRQSLKYTPAGHLARPSLLNNLSISLYRQFGLLGQRDDLKQAIEYQRQALELTPMGHPFRSSILNNLGSSLQFSFQHFRQIDDLKQAILYQRQALDLTPVGHPDAPIHLNNLGNSLYSYFEYIGQVDDLDQAIQYQRKALELSPVGHPDRSTWLNNLGHSLNVRFQHLEQIGDLEQAIQYQQQAIESMPADSPDRCHRLTGVALALLARFKHLKLSKDSEQMFKYLIEAAGIDCPDHHSSLPFHRFNAAYLLARCAIPFQLDDLAYNASEQAMKLLPKIVWSGSPVEDQHSQLLRVRVTEIVQYAASVAISVKKYDTALEWLEQGRSVVWSHILQLHTPFDDLKHNKPVLASRLLQASEQLKETRKIIDSDLKNSQRTREQLSQKHHQLALEWDKLVIEVRKVPGFERFFLPKQISELRKAAQAGPVVILNATVLQCDALLLGPDSSKCTHVSLSGITYQDVQKLQAHLQNILLLQGRDASGDFTEAQSEDIGLQYSSETSSRHLGRKKCVMIPEKIEKEMQLILSTLWGKVVEPIINALSLKALSSDTLPHVFWCPTGPFMSLPIHAAGIYTEDKSHLKLSNFCISSYTPTISALLPSSSAMNEEVKILSIGVSKAPGQAHLPSVQTEVDYIQMHASAMGVHLTKQLEPTIADVKAAIKHHNWVHFACHGIQDTARPLSSGLILSDGMLKLSDIIHLTGSSKGMAFLSACQTAKGVSKLADESIHIAAGMQLAGYKSVIATMWSIEDMHASEIAADVYKELFKTKIPDHTQSAVALHKAVENLKKKHQNLSFLTWVPYIHIGC